MKKLFVWLYTHTLPNTLCMLTEDGKMLFHIDADNGKRSIDLLVAGNEGLKKLYDVHVIDQQILEDHMYHGKPRETLDLDFRLAWDKYKLGEATGN